MHRVLGPVAGGVTVTESVYMRVQAEQIELLLAHRSGATERQLIERMLAHHELRRRQVSDKLDPLQLPLNLPRRRDRSPDQPSTRQPDNH